ncbi:SH3 domain-containing protein [Eubacteriales bacterium OttesenSCG-928-N13]|nr:SH3 domain-containing protein [Eubacteriales bacterium OttesenSCG-928-N13]
MLKRSISAMLVMVLLLSVFGAMPAMASTSTKVITSTSGLTIRVRKEPDSDSSTKTVAYVKNGYGIKLLEEIDGDEPEEWSYIKVNYNGAKGYLKNKYIKSLVNEYDYNPGNGKAGGSGPYNPGSGTTSSSSKVKLGVVSTSGGSVNVRSTPNGSVKSTASNGSRLTLSGKSGNWYKVKTSRGVSGYIHQNYVDEGIPGYTTADRGVNMRKGAGTKYGVIKTLSYGTSIRVLARNSSWSYIKAGSSKGYISNSYYSYD